MSTRIKVDKVDPAGYATLLGIEKYLSKSKLTHIQKELIKIRASQINGCAFCLDMHTKDARKYGETEQRIYCLNAWRDTDFYSEEEQALLALTEEVTLISKGGVSDATYTRVAMLFEEEMIAQIIIAIIAINAWNRLAITTHLMPTRD